MKRLFVILVVVISIISFRMYANVESTSQNSKDNLANASNDELVASIKSDAYKIGEKCKILSKRYYGKAQVAAKEGKKDLSNNYKSYADAFKEMSNGFEQNKTEMVSKGKENYKKAVAKMKKLSNDFFDSIDANDGAKITK
jgi:hypothetical protein